MAIESTLVKYLSEPTGLYALLTLIPLLVIYLIKPKPKKRVIPALMFFMQDSGKSTLHSLFKHFFKDPLMIVQILILIVAALALAQPFMEVPQLVSGKEVVIIIDGSASSQAIHEGSRTRFDEQIAIAKDFLAKKNTIILAGSSPEIIGENLNSGDAEDRLDSLKPKDTPTNLYDSMMLAGNFLDDKGTVFVLSDLIQTEEGLDIETAKDLLETRGIKVIFKRVFKEAKNVGIINLDVKEEGTVMLVRNYNPEAVDIKVKAGSFEEDVHLDSRSTELVSFTTPRSTTKVELDIPSGQDQFEPDNTAFMTFPAGRNINVLLLSNDRSKYLPLALNVIDYVHLTESKPPKSPDINDFNVIITQNVDGKLILPGTMKDVMKKVERGGALVIMAQEGLFQTDFRGMLPVSYNSMREDADVHVVMDTQFTKDVNFGHVSKHFDVDATDGIVLAETSEEVPMLILKKYGQGNIVYYGIMDDESSFKLDMYYPIFWKRLLDFLTDQKDITKINLKTGAVRYLDSDDAVKLPDGKRKKTGRLLLEQVGAYRQGDEEFVASLVDEKESDINGETVETKTRLIQETSFKEKKKQDLTTWFIIALLFLVFTELIWLKIRGDV
ncbi:MAG: BatA domain-containing protein [Candidatus Nanoarchaeia archaeon]